MPRKMKLQSITQAWRKAVEEGEVWNEEKRDEEEAGAIPLRDIMCHAYGARHAR